MRALALLTGLLAGGCVPNPRNDMPAVVAAAVTWFAERMPATPFCVERQVVPWQPAGAVRNTGSPPPGFEGPGFERPGFEELSAAGVFRGGGGIRADRLGRAVVGTGAACADLRGPLIAGDRAMVEIHRPGGGRNLWLRRDGGRWQVVAMTASR